MTYISREEFYHSLDNIKSEVFSRLSELENDVCRLKQGYLSWKDRQYEALGRIERLEITLETALNCTISDIEALKTGLKETQQMIFDPFNFNNSVLKGISNKEEQ